MDDFATLYREYHKTGILTTQFAMHYVITNCDITRVSKDFDPIYKAIEEFSEYVYDAWLQDYYNKATTKGHRATYKKVKLMVWGMCGRIVVTIEDKDGYHVTLYGLEDNPGIGLHGIYAKAETAVQLLSFVTDNQQVFRKSICPNKEVTMFPGLTSEE